MKTAALTADGLTMLLPSWVRTTLPQGRTLPRRSWQYRHRGLLALLAAHAAGLPVFALAQGYSLVHSLLEGAIVGAFVAVALVARSNHRFASLVVSIGLVVSSALVVHIWRGVIEGHFHFFVIVIFLALYEDWLPFLAAAVFVVVHHGLMGAISPESVYNHPQAIAHPWKWAVIHGVFVVFAGIGAVITWRLNEEVRAEWRRARRKAEDSERHFRSAFEEAPIGMCLSAIDGANVQYMQVNRAMCEMTGYTEAELLGRSFLDITHPDDRDDNLEGFRAMLRGEADVIRVEKRYLRADGSVAWGLTGVSLVRDATGRPLHVISQVQDITERKAAQERLEYRAFHDPLTGLYNRRQLIDDLEEQARTSGPPSLVVVFDLDGFKSYNDAFGHSAGDALLSRLGHRLERTVGSRGRAYRMGGDEFCVLAEDEEALIEAAAAALTDHGDGFTITASHGSVSIPDEAQQPMEVLRIADQRMYARKNSARASAGRQATDALAMAVAERNPTLSVHQRDVTDLCRAVAELLGVALEEQMPLLQAAALHDIGKIAVPDTILEKPGPLDDEEWQFMRAHTVIGERILGVAPSLARSAPLVRASHERWDGSGYPDRLTGVEIPLGARIIAVCDAFDAMTSPRPYREPLTDEAAVAELRRHAGTQFDPAVVEAFVRAVSLRTAA